MELTNNREVLTLFPKINDSRQKGITGETYFQHFVYEELNCIYHKNSEENDYGIDGFIELVENGLVFGKRVAVQIKHGDSFFSNRQGGGYRYVGENKHLNYYLNCDVPVFIIIMDTVFERMKWVQFRIEKTMPAGEGKWWIEVPEKNDMKRNFRRAIFQAAGPAIDYGESIQEDWFLSEIMQNVDFFTIAVPKRETENGDYSCILSYISRISRNRNMLMKARNTLEICFPEYAGDMREIYQIPEIRRWLKESVETGIPWFYLLNYGWKSTGLAMLMEAFCCEEPAKEDKDMQFLKVDMERCKEFLEISFGSLNYFMQKNDLAGNINVEISEGIMSYYDRYLIGK